MFVRQLIIRYNHHHDATDIFQFDDNCGESYLKIFDIMRVVRNIDNDDDDNGGDDDDDDNDENDDNDGMSAMTFLKNCEENHLSPAPTHSTCLPSLSAIQRRSSWI